MWIWHWQATDPDEDDILTYSITAGNEDGSFHIDPSRWVWLCLGWVCVWGGGQLVDLGVH